jgi:hypothetical protein
MVRLLDGRSVTAVGLTVGIAFTAGAAFLAFLPGARDFWQGVAVGSSSMACLALVVLAAFFAVVGWGEASIGITQPRAGDTVVVETIVRGDFERLADDERIWVAVVPLDLDQELFHPQNGPAERLPRGRWQATAFVGLDDPSDFGRSFRLVAFVADAAADEQLRRYLVRGRLTGDYPGLPSLPSGTKTMDAVTVTRRQS